MLIKKKNRKEKNKIGDSNNEIIYDDLDVANTFNEYFHYAITKLGTATVTAANTNCFRRPSR